VRIPNSGAWNSLRQPAVTDRQHVCPIPSSLYAAVLQFQELLRGRLPAKRHPGPPVQLGGNIVKLLVRVDGQVRPLGEVLPQKAVGVLVGAPLPRRVRVAEENLQVKLLAYLAVERKLGALIPGQRFPKVLREILHFPYHLLLHGVRRVVLGQVEQDAVSGLALDEGAYGGLVAPAHYQVAFPVPRDGTVVCLGRPLAYVHHRLPEPRLCRFGAPLRRLAARPALAHQLPELLLQAALALYVNGAVNGFGRQAHGSVLGICFGKVHGYLHGRPAVFQKPQYINPKAGLPGCLALLGAQEAEPEIALRLDGIGLFQHSTKEFTMKTNKHFLLAAIFGFALAFTFSCSSDGDGDGGSFNENSQIYNRDGNTIYKGNGIIGAAYSCGYDDDCWIKVGSVTNGIVNLELDKVVPDDEYLKDFPEEQRSCTSYPENIKIFFGGDDVYALIDGNGNLIGGLTISYEDEYVMESIFYAYFSETGKIACNSSKRNFNLDVKKGWNKIYFHRDNNKGAIREYSTNNLLTKEKELKWIVWIEGEE